MLPAVWLTANRNGAVGDIARETGPLSVAKILVGFTVDNNTVAYRHGKIAVALVDVQQRYVIAGKVGYIKEVAGGMRRPAPTDWIRQENSASPKAPALRWTARGTQRPHWFPGPPHTQTACVRWRIRSKSRPHTPLKTLFRRKRPKTSLPSLNLLSLQLKESKGYMKLRQQSAISRCMQPGEAHPRLLARTPRGPVSCRICFCPLSSARKRPSPRQKLFLSRGDGRRMRTCPAQSFSKLELA